MDLVTNGMEFIISISSVASVPPSSEGEGGGGGTCKKKIGNGPVEDTERKHRRQVCRLERDGSRKQKEKGERRGVVQGGRESCWWFSSSDSGSPYSFISL